MKTIIRSTKSIRKNEIIDHNAQALSFIDSGVSCFIISMLDNLGLIDLILSKGFLCNKDLLKFPNRLVLKKAVFSLSRNRILLEKDGLYYLTELGASILEHRGSIGLIYSGYSNVLANQTEYALDGAPPSNACFDSKSIARASIHFGEKNIDPLVVSLVKKLKIKGQICDLGCGACTRLIKLCEQTGLNGIGIELAPGAVKLAKENTRHVSNISVKKGDIMNLNHIFPKVEIIMQFFVMHDIASEKESLLILNSYRDSFPKLKFFIYTDVVAPSDNTSPQLPGFDYVHGLLGINPRTYEETVNLFSKLKFRICEEHSIANLPNTYLWVLQPE